MKKSVYKVPGGKLLKISLEPEDNRIKSIRIMGDFFLHPEESITELEDGLKGADVGTNDEKKSLQDARVSKSYWNRKHRSSLPFESCCKY